MRRLTADQVRRARVAGNGLGEFRARNVVDVVRRVVGVQGQDVRASRLAVRVRSDALTAGDVDAACRERVVVRTWAMRGTLHLLAAEDFGWVVGLLGPYFAARGVGRRRQLGLDDGLLARAADGLGEILREPLTRGEVVERLGEVGVAVEPRGQASVHLLAWAANSGLVCRGPETDGGAATYVLVREWLGEQVALGEGEALGRLAQRYLVGYGPATADDFAAWSGLPLGRARAGFEAVGSRAERVELGGVEGLSLGGGKAGGVEGLGGGAAGGIVRLLGHFDAYLLGYRGRELAVPPELASVIQAGGGFVMPAVLVDGRVVGTWRSSVRKGGLVVSVESGRKISRRIRNEVADLGRFLGLGAELAEANG